MQLSLLELAEVAPKGSRCRTSRDPLGRRALCAESSAPVAKPLLELAAARYIAEAHAQRTRKAYQTDWAAFETWCAAQGRAALPASCETLVLYLTALAELGRKASTIRRARTAIGLAHGYAGQPRPDRAAVVRALERGIARVHGAREEGSDPLLERDVARLVDGLGDRAREARDRALILLGFAGAFRASELASLQVRNIAFTELGLRVTIERSKEDQLALGAHTDIPYGSGATCPVAALVRWMARLGTERGPLFCAVAGERVTQRPIHPRAVSRAVQRAAARAGLRGAYSAHSLRSGLATSAYAHGVTEREIQAHGRWKDRRSLDRYIRVAFMPDRKNAAAGLL